MSNVTSSTIITVSSLLLLVTSACATDDEPDAETGERADVMYYEDVAPIIDMHCHACHRSGGAGPFVFETHEDVTPLAKLIAHTTQARTMPPWLADNSGSCRTYTDANWLSEDQITTIQDWVDGGALAGDPATSPSFDSAPETLGDATHTLRPAAAYVPNTMVDDDDYHCFIIDPELDNKKYLTAFEVVPGNPEIVHHVVVYTPDDEAALRAAHELDEAEPGDGYTCFGGSNIDATPAAIWAPGRPIWRYPEGTGVPIEPRLELIVQIHYHVEAGLPPDQTAVRLRLMDSVDTELLPWFFAATDLVLPPGQAAAPAAIEISLGDYMRDKLERPEYATPMTIVGIGPHMHELGSQERVELIPARDAASECLADVPRWDFDWQFAYFFEEPVRVEPEDLLRMTCSFDTRSVDHVVEWGNGTDDEMCLALMFSTFDEGVIPQ